MSWGAVGTTASGGGGRAGGLGVVGVGVSVGWTWRRGTAGGPDCWGGRGRERWAWQSWIGGGVSAERRDGVDGGSSKRSSDREWDGSGWK